MRKQRLQGSEGVLGGGEQRQWWAGGGSGVGPGVDTSGGGHVYVVGEDARGMGAGAL